MIITWNSLFAGCAVEHLVMEEVNEKFTVGEDGVRIDPDSLEAADN
jgi:hypothetical protein